MLASAPMTIETVLLALNLAVLLFIARGVSVISKQGAKPAEASKTEAPAAKAEAPAAKAEDSTTPTATT